MIFSRSGEAILTLVEDFQSVGRGLFEDFQSVGRGLFDTF